MRSKSIFVTRMTIYDVISPHLTKLGNDSLFTGALGS